MIPAVPRGPLASLRHAFLIRDPERVLTSYAKVRHEPTLEDLGLPQQVELFETFGGPVIDAVDLLRDPRSTLTRLCDALGIGFDDAMLAWPAGPRDTDGVWAPYWYAGVEACEGGAGDRAAVTPYPRSAQPSPVADSGRARRFHSQERRPEHREHARDSPVGAPRRSRTIHGSTLCATAPPSPVTCSPRWTSRAARLGPPVQPPTTGKRGRPSAPTYHLNPYALGTTE